MAESGRCSHRLVEVHLHENTHSVLINGHDTEQPMVEAITTFQPLPEALNNFQPLTEVLNSKVPAVGKLLLDADASPNHNNHSQNGYVETHF
jgi:hypothetical protein